MELLARIGDYLSALLTTTGAALRLNQHALDNLGSFQWSVPVGIAIIGGASTMLGQNAVMAINRIRGLRKVLTLLGAGVGLVATGTVQAVLALLVSRLLPEGSWHLRQLLPGVLVAFAPYWLGFLVLIPYSGPGIARLLQAWNLVALWSVLTIQLGTDRLTGLGVALVAWLGSFGLGFVFEHSRFHVRDRLFCLVSGSPGLSAQDLMNDVALPDDTGADA